MMSHSLSLGGAERVAFDRRIIRKLGKWCQSVQNEDVERSDDEQRDVEHMLRHCKLTDEAKQYYEIIRFKHDMIKNDLLRNTLLKEKPQRDAMEETSEALDFLYHYMEGNVNYEERNYHASLLHYQTAKLYMKNIRGKKRAALFLQLGENLLQLGQDKLAKTQFNEALHISFGAYDQQNEYKRSQNMLASIQEPKSSPPVYESLLSRSLKKARSTHTSKDLSRFETVTGTHL